MSVRVTTQPTVPAILLERRGAHQEVSEFAVFSSQQDLQSADRFPLQHLS
jgi:hypothetical protein